MAREKRVPLNRLVSKETFEAVKELAEVLKCSEGEVLDQAVMLLGDGHRSGVDLRGERSSAEEMVRARENLGVVYSDPRQIPGVVVGVANLPKKEVELPDFSRGETPADLPMFKVDCGHCGSKFMSSSRRSIVCDECFDDGHRGTRYACERCRENNPA